MSLKMLVKIQYLIVENQRFFLILDVKMSKSLHKIKLSLPELIAYKFLIS